MVTFWEISLRWQSWPWLWRSLHPAVTPPNRRELRPLPLCCHPDCRGGICFVPCRGGLYPERCRRISPPSLAFVAPSLYGGTFLLPSFRSLPRPSFRTKQADFFLRTRSCECVGLRM